MVANRSPFFSKEEDLLTESCRTLPNQERQNTTIDNTSIELLWRMIKYHWLPLKAYDSFKSLVRNLADIFSRIGKNKEYFLTFDGPCLSTSASS